MYNNIIKRYVIKFLQDVKDSFSASLVRTSLVNSFWYLDSVLVTVWLVLNNAADRE